MRKMKRTSISRRMPERERVNIFNKRLIFILAAVFVSLILLLLLNSSPPQIISASVYPLKIMPGQVMIVTVQAKDTLGIKSAVAIFDNEKMPDERNIPLITGTRRDGVYETRWIAHDTKNQAWYNTTIIFTNFLGKKSEQKIAWQDPTESHTADKIMPGTFGAGDYTFPGNLNVTGNLTNQREIVISQLSSSPSNSTGSGKIYYKAAETVIDSYTKLLLHMDGSDAANASTAVDSSPSARTVAGSYGNAQLDTAQSKFGSASLLLDGTGDGITYADSADWNFGSGDFTIDMWVRFAAINAVQELYGQYENPDYIDFFLNNNNKLYFYAYATSAYVAYYVYDWSASVATNTWYHIALVRNGENLYLFIDGVSKTWTTVTTPISTNSLPTITNALYIGSYIGVDNWLNGWIDEFRVSKGIARWTANFNAPTSAYADVTGGLYFQYQNGTEKLLAGE